jgi:7-cyano-7-deazaguanine synthase
MNKKYAVLSLSGGMDSSTLLLHLLNEGYDCTCLSFDYGQKHKVELERATELVKYIKFILVVPEDNLVGNIYFVKHQIIKLDGLAQLLNSSLVEGGSEIPEGHYEHSNMASSVVPNRNKIFSSIIQAVALSIAEKNNTECIIALGIHAGDHQIYRDCRQEFRDTDYEAFLEGNENGHLVIYNTPFLHTDKFGILEDGVKCCESLGLDFDEVYKRTNTSYKPYPSGHSDYKSASSVERVEAFIKLGRPDPVVYEDEDGIASWSKVTKYVTKVIEEFNKNKNL